MVTQKMSLANIKGKLSRAEMKNIMAGSGDDEARCQQSTCNTSCTTKSGHSGYCYANAETGTGICYCVAAY